MEPSRPYSSQQIFDLSPLATLESGMEKLSISECTETNTKVRKQFSLFIESNKTQNSSPDFLDKQFDEMLAALRHVAEIIPCYARTINRFATKLIIQSSPPFVNALPTDELKQILAQLIYLTGENPQRTSSNIDLNDIERSISILKNKTKKSLQRQKDVLENHYTEQRIAGIQNPALFYKTERTRLLSKLLITSTGYFNSHLIPCLIEIFFDKSEKGTGKKLIKTLKRIASNKELQQKICQARPPQSKKCISNYAIRACTQDFIFILSETEAKRACLSAALTITRQPPIGSCFASSWLIAKKELLFSQVIDDYLHLLEEGILRRNVDGKLQEFSCELNIADRDLYREFTIQPDGSVNSSKMHVCIAPGIYQGLGRMGIQTNYKECVIKALTSFGEFGSKPIKMTAFKLFAKVATTLFPTDSINKLQLATFGFSSLTNNALDRMLENIYAGMAQAHKKDRDREKIENLVFSIFKEHFSNDYSYNELHTVNLIQNKFRKTFRRKIDFLFYPDLNIPLATPRYKEPQSAFALVDTYSGKTGRQRKIIDSVCNLRKLILNIIETTKETIKATSQNEQRVSTIEMTLEKVKNLFSNENTFISGLVKHFQPKADRKGSPITNLKETSSLRWLYQGSGNEKLVITTDLNRGNIGKIQRVITQNAYSLLLYILHRAQTRAKQQSVPRHHLNMGFNKNHSFNWIVSNQAINSAIQDPFSISRWIKQNLEYPLQDLAQQIVDENIFNSITQAALELFPEQNRSDFQQDRHILNLKGTSLKHARNIIHKILFEHLYSNISNEKQTDKIIRKIDSLLFNNLPEPLHKLFRKSCVHIADTNWYYTQDKSEYTVHYCIFYNPFTHMYQYAQINDDGTNLHIMDQNVLKEVYFYS